MKALEYERRPLLLTFRETSRIKETYAGRTDTVALEAHHLVPKGVASRTVLVFMHPIGGTHYLPMVTGFAKAGVPVISCNSRYPRNDSALILEKVALDLAACVRHAREKLGYEKVLLAGWSGGGSLALFYQSQAERPTVTCTPAGEPPDLTQADLPRADGLLFLAAHQGRAVTLTEWLDPSITDEARPHERDPALNLYDPRNPNKPPYDAKFLRRYRDAQLERNRRITRWVQATLEAARRRGDDTFEHCFVVHGTMAEPAWLDPAIEPSERKPNWCYMGDPRMVNDAPAGLGRYTTLRSWLSQWSVDLTNVDAVKAAPSVSVPVCLIQNSADDACLPHHVERLYAALTRAERERHVIAGANHYYYDQPEKLAEALAIGCDWMRRREFLAA